MVESYLEVLQKRLRFSKKKVAADAAVLVAITDELDPKILFTRRSVHLSQHAGEVSFPGGKREVGDTSNIVVALRETQEETALDPFCVKLIGDLPLQTARNGLSVKPIVGIIPSNVILKPQPTEIDRIFYISIAELLETPVSPYEVNYAQQIWQFPSLQIDNEIIWGLTARILIELFDYGLNYQKEWPFLLGSRLQKSKPLR